MLLIAIAGEVGTGKTTLLQGLCDRFLQEGKTVEGFLAEAADRDPLRKGARRYLLRWAGQAETLPLAERVEEKCIDGIPYRFDPSTLDLTVRWARELAAGGPPDLLVLDEFSRLESAGKGHMALWSDILAARPLVVAIAVRASVLREVEQALGRRFDVVISTEEEDAGRRLAEVVLAHEDWCRVGLFGAASGGIELSLGALLHGSMVPLRGLILSSLQAFIMTQAASGLAKKSRVIWTPFISAGLKALSPAGSRLRPMLAIAAQGVLYTGCTTLFGWNALGVAAGSALIGMWAAAQGLLLEYLLLGSSLLTAYRGVLTWLKASLGISPPHVTVAILGWIGLWGVVSAVVGLVSFATRKPVLDRVKLPTLRITQTPSWRTALKRGLRDLGQPIFWLPLLLVVGIILALGSSWETAAWMVLRAFTVGLLLFSAVQLLDLQSVVRWLQRRGHWGPAVALSSAIDRIVDSSRSTRDER